MMLTFARPSASLKATPPPHRSRRYPPKPPPPAPHLRINASLSPPTNFPKSPTSTPASISPAKRSPSGTQRQRLQRSLHPHRFADLTNPNLLSWSSPSTGSPSSSPAPTSSRERIQPRATGPPVPPVSRPPRSHRRRLFEQIVVLPFGNPANASPPAPSADPPRLGFPTHPIAIGMSTSPSAPTGPSSFAATSEVAAPPPICTSPAPPRAAPRRRRERREPHPRPADRRLDIALGRVFSTPPILDPVLNLRGRSKIRDYVITVLISGAVNDPKSPSPATPRSPRGHRRPPLHRRHRKELTAAPTSSRTRRPPPSPTALQEILPRPAGERAVA